MISGATLEKSPKQLAQLGTMLQPMLSYLSRGHNCKIVSAPL